MFKLAVQQQEKLNEWLKEHDAKCKFLKSLDEDESVLIGRLTYCFTPNEFNNSLVVVCACGESIDLT